MTKSQLQNLVNQRGEEIRGLITERDRLLKEIEELNQMNDDLNDKKEARGEDQEILLQRDRLAREIIEELQLNSLRGYLCSRIPRTVFDLLTDWEQAGFNLSGG